MKYFIYCKDYNSQIAFSKLFCLTILFLLINSCSQKIKTFCLNSESEVSFLANFKGNLGPYKKNILYKIECNKINEYCSGIIIDDLDELRFSSIFSLLNLKYQKEEKRYSIKWGPYRELFYIPSHSGDKVILEEHSGVYDNKTFKEVDRVHATFEMTCPKENIM